MVRRFVLTPRRPSPETLRRLLADARLHAPTYAEIGATRAQTMPAGYRHDSCETDLGQGAAVYARAVRALRNWQAQIGAGVEVVPSDARVEDRETVLLVIHVGPFWATAPCRVVYVTDEPDHFSFAYGTLPGHPEVGEVAFFVSSGEAGRVALRVRSFSRTIDPFARLGAPIARRLQKRVTHRYLDAVRDAALKGPRNAKARNSSAV